MMEIERITMGVLTEDHGIIIKNRNVSSVGDLGIQYNAAIIGLKGGFKALIQPLMVNHLGNLLQINITILLDSKLISLQLMPLFCSMI